MQKGRRIIRIYDAEQRTTYRQTASTLYAGNPLKLSMVGTYKLHPMLLDHFLRNPYTYFANTPNFSSPFYNNVNQHQQVRGRSDPINRPSPLHLQSHNNSRDLHQHVTKNVYHRWPRLALALSELHPYHFLSLDMTAFIQISAAGKNTCIDKTVHILPLQRWPADLTPVRFRC